MDPQLKPKRKNKKQKKQQQQQKKGNEGVVNREEMDGGHMRPTDVY